MNQIHTPKTVLNRMNYTKGDPDSAQRSSVCNCTQVVVLKNKTSSRLIYKD